jgi:hypothetical protein
MRYLAARIVILFLYGSAILLLPAWYLSARPSLCAAKTSAMGTCSCCINMGGAAGHKCSCENCNCKISSNEQSDPPPFAARPGELRPQGALQVVLDSTPLVLTAIDYITSPYLPISTPPPKSRLS